MTDPIRIQDLADPRLDDYRNLRDGELSRARGAFIAESEVVVRVLIERGRFPVRSLLLADARLDKLADLLPRIAADVPVYVASQAVLDGIVGFHIHRGVLASGARLPPQSATDLLGMTPASDARVVVLESLTNHDNVGGVFRNAAAFGAEAVLFDKATCDPLYRKAIRVSVGGSLIVPYAEGTLAEHVAVLRARGYTIVALSPSDPRSENIAEMAPLGPVALLLGTEGAGLTPAALDAADRVAKIDIVPAFDSLNVATTCGIALHRVRSWTRHRG